MVVRNERAMKLLVLEQNEVISNIYKKIFDEKKFRADYAKNESECLEKFDDNYDYVVLEDLKSSSLESEIKKIKPSQKILTLEPYINSDGPLELKETRDLIEKPFAILTLFGKLEIENPNQYV
jgi:DNA-binding NtrC family response regulator